MIKVNAYVWASIIEMLTAAASNHEIAQRTGLNYETVREYTSVLHKKKIIFVDHWDQDRRGAYTVAVYRLGDGKDAKRPKPRSSTQRRRDQRARERALRMVHAMAGQPQAVAAP